MRNSLSIGQLHPASSFLCLSLKQNITVSLNIPLNHDFDDVKYELNFPEKRKQKICKLHKLHIINDIEINLMKNNAKTKVMVLKSWFRATRSLANAIKVKVQVLKVRKRSLK